MLKNAPFYQKVFAIHSNYFRSITANKKPKPTPEESSKTSAAPVEPKEEVVEKGDDITEDDNVETDEKVDEDATMAVEEEPTVTK